MYEKVSDLQTRLHTALSLRGKKAIDLTKDLGIPRSAVSQYLSGKSQKMDDVRLHTISQYLNVSETWLLGYDVAIQNNYPYNSTELTKPQLQLIDLAFTLPPKELERILQIINLILE